MVSRIGGVFASKRVKSALAVGTLSWAVFYLHLSDTGGSIPSSPTDLSIVKRASSGLACIGQSDSSASYEMVYKADSDFARRVLENGELADALGRYKPSWFYLHHLVGGILSVMQQ